MVLRNALILFRDLQMYQTEMISAHVSISTSDRKWRSQNFTARFYYLEETVSSDVIDKVLNSEWEFRKLRINGEKKWYCWHEISAKLQLMQITEYGTNANAKCVTQSRSSQPTSQIGRSEYSFYRMCCIFRQFSDLPVFRCLQNRCLNSNFASENTTEYVTNTPQWPK